MSAIHGHHRRSIRLQNFNYTQAGAYFITVRTQNGRCLFGEVVDGLMRPNETGRVVVECWRAITDHFPNTDAGEHIVMPNHMHGIVWICLRDDDFGPDLTAAVGARHAVPLQHQEQFGKPIAGSVPTILRSFKSSVTKSINAIHHTSGAELWQRNFYEHVIRNENELNRIRNYILYNPARWEWDRENPTGRHP